MIIDAQNQRAIYAHLDSLRETGGVNIVRVKDYLERELEFGENEQEEPKAGSKEHFQPNIVL